MTHALIKQGMAGPQQNGCPSLDQVTDKFEELYQGKDGVGGLKDLETLIPAKGLFAHSWGERYGIGIAKNCWITPSISRVCPAAAEKPWNLTGWGSLNKKQIVQNACIPVISQMPWIIFSQPEQLRKSRVNAIGLDSFSSCKFCREHFSMKMMQTISDRILPSVFRILSVFRVQCNLVDEKMYR